jgi:hypothetical protein
MITRQQKPYELLGFSRLLRKCEVKYHWFYNEISINDKLFGWCNVSFKDGYFTISAHSALCLSYNIKAYSTSELVLKLEKLKVFSDAAISVLKSNIKLKPWR